MNDATPTVAQQKATAHAILAEIGLAVTVAQVELDRPDSSWLVDRIGLIEQWCAWSRRLAGIPTDPMAFEGVLAMLDGLLGAIVEEPGDGSALQVALDELAMAAAHVDGTIDAGDLP